MHEMIQLLVSFTGSLGFAVLFNIHGKKLWFAALGGCLSWAVYLIVGIWTSSPYICGFWSTVTITLYAECMARIHKTPVTVFLVSATIPLIPGAALYRTMNLYNSFCGKYGSRNDTDDDFLSDGLELEIPPAVDVREGVVKNQFRSAKMKQCTENG